jgi:hypothetical protein
MADYINFYINFYIKRSIALNGQDFFSRKAVVLVLKERQSAQGYLYLRVSR